MKTRQPISDLNSVSQAFANAAGTTVHDSTLVTGHARSPKRMEGVLGILLARTYFLSTLELPEFYFARRPLSFPTKLLEGPRKVRPENLLTARSPFGPNFRTGFFRTPTQAKGPQGGPCLCLRLPVHVRAILPATLSQACCAADIGYR